MNNMLGRIDPKTGKVKEYPLKTKHSGPHGLVEDKDGNIWYTAQQRRIDRQARPEDRCRDRVQDAGPAAEIRTRSSSTAAEYSGSRCRTPTASGGSIRRPATSSCSRGHARSRPYGMALDSKGTPFVVQFGVNKIARVDPKTLEIREYTLPAAASRPAAHSDQQRRHRLVRRLFARLPGAARPGERQGDGVSVAERAEVRALRHIDHQRRDLVQRIRVDSEHSRALRPRDGEIPELEDSGRRQHRAQYLGHAGGQLRARQQLVERGDAGHDLEVKRRGATNCHRNPGRARLTGRLKNRLAGRCQASCGGRLRLDRRG